MIIGITATFLHFQSYPISLFDSWCCSMMLVDVSMMAPWCLLMSQVLNGCATSIVWYSLVVLSTVMMSAGLLCSNIWYGCMIHWYGLTLPLQYHFLAFS